MTNKVPPCQLLAPIGVWRESFSEPLVERHSERRIVYFGSMDNRNGVPFLAEIFSEMLNQDSQIRIDVIGEGNASPLMQDLAIRYPTQFTFHGYMENQVQIDEILRCSVVAIAPYDESPGSFTKFADPQKLKYYASNGVPTILTNVAPAAQVMRDRGAALLLSKADGINRWTESIFSWLNNSDLWFEAAKNSYSYALDFERTHVYSRTISSLIGLLDSR
jgi:glycosyltransferase involved in cell wall biosynthesis